MSSPGYVYILLNVSLPGLIKVGRTERSPDERAKEISASTGVPTPFMVAYQEYFDDCHSAEAYVHFDLEGSGYRVATNREFFNAPLNVAINSVLQAKRNFGASSFLPALGGSGTDLPGNPPLAGKSANEILELAEAAYHGQGDTLQDFSEAYTLYKAVADAKPAKTQRKLGVILRDGLAGRKDIHAALNHFKLGATHDDVWCLAEMAILFQREGNRLNEYKCWKKFFEVSTEPKHIDMYNRPDKLEVLDQYVFEYIECGFACERAAEFNEEFLSDTGEKTRLLRKLYAQVEPLFPLEPKTPGAWSPPTYPPKPQPPLVSKNIDEARRIAKIARFIVLNWPGSHKTDLAQDISWFIDDMPLPDETPKSFWLERGRLFMIPAFFGHPPSLVLADRMIGELAPESDIRDVLEVGSLVSIDLYEKLVTLLKKKGQLQELAALEARAINRFYKRDKVSV